MNIKTNKQYCIGSFDVVDINNKEMRQMYELSNRIGEVLNSHLPNAKEKKYINDDDLKLMHAILNVFTKEYSSTQTSAFDDELKAIDEKVKKMLETPETPQQEEDDE
jgi:benzoyl-CoA reductase/2-hydroxyglutaryl-CoA dehydratase subunit BcrC/BadD/HgdB